MNKLTLEQKDLRRAPFMDEAKQLLEKHAAGVIVDIADALAAIEEAKAIGHGEGLREALEDNTERAFEDFDASPDTDSMFEVATHAHYDRHPEDLERDCAAVNAAHPCDGEQKSLMRGQNKIYPTNSRFLWAKQNGKWAPLYWCSRTAAADAGFFPPEKSWADQLDDLAGQVDVAFDESVGGHTPTVADLVELLDAHDAVETLCDGINAALSDAASADLTAAREALAARPKPSNPFKRNPWAPCPRCGEVHDAE